MAVRIDSEGAAAILASLMPLRVVRPFVQANPAAGTEVVLTVPGGVVWELLSVRATFTASAAVANRRPSLRITDADGLDYQRYHTRVDIAAAGVANYNWITGLGYQDTVEPALYGLPALPFPLPQSWAIRTVTSAIDVADQWSNVRVVVREWAADRIADVVSWIEADILGLIDPGAERDSPD